MVVREKGTGRIPKPKSSRKRVTVPLEYVRILNSTSKKIILNSQHTGGPHYVIQ